MNPLTIANAVANIIVVIAVSGMAIRVFGDPSHQIHGHKNLFYIRKFISSLVICGAVLNLATLSTPSWTEIVLNYAFAANYCFSLFYSYHDRFTNRSNAGVVAKVSKPQRPRKTSGAPKTSPNFATTRKRRERASSR